MSNDIGRTELSELGEFGLIRQLTEKIKLTHSGSLLGVGDDAAVIQPTDGMVQVITTDMLTEGVHFDLAYVPLKHLGYKAVVANISDVCAMNAYARQITVSLAVSNRFSVEALEELYSGIYLACEKYKVDIVGGDTTTSLSGLTISITAIGEQIGEKVVKRSGAKDGDLLVVTGDLGGAFMGLQILEREKQIFVENPEIQPDLGGNDYLLERQLKPEARADIIDMLLELDLLPTSMIDISDGLSSEVLHLCHGSKVGCHLYEEKIPIDPLTSSQAAEFNLDPPVCALNGGEDYELLFTVAQKDFDKIKGSPHFTVIGHMVDAAAGAQLITRDGQQHTLTAQGWNPLY